MNDKQKQPMGRLKVAAIYLLTYLAAILCAALPYLLDLSSVIQIACLFPLGFFWVFGEPKNGESFVLVVGYAVYVILFNLGVALRSKKVYIIFVILLVLNIAGCYYGKHLQDIRQNGDDLSEEMRR